MAKGFNLGTALGIGLLGFGGYYLLRRRPETGSSLLGDLIGADIAIGGGAGGGITAVSGDAPAQPAPAAQPQYRSYTTQGESLEDISARFFGGERGFAPILYALNEDVIGQNRDIRGRTLVLRIPTQAYLQQILRYIFPASGGPITPPNTGTGGYLGRPAQTPDRILATRPRTVTYTVLPGDTLSAIAARYRTTWQAIYERNRAVIGVNPNVIYPGQVLEVPVGS